MSWLPDQPPIVEAAPCPALETVIVARPRDLGGFSVRRALPAASRRMVGPFIFLDQMGPADFAAGTGIDVRPHPHIGLATVTYLFEGEILHRDSLGSVQPIRSGAVNWMTAGKGIAHSERSDPALRQSPQRLSGIQAWVALPKRHEEMEPAFVHHPQDALPVIAGEGKEVRLIAGALYGKRSPVETLWELFYADAMLAAGARLEVPADHEERAIYVADGQIEVGGQTFGPGGLLVFRAGDAITVTGKTAARLMLLGGAAMDGPRHIWWNFVSSSQERIEQAKADWQAGRFGRVPGDPEFIPLPT